MKTKTINLYSFEELSEDAKKKAIESLSDINTSFEWWESTYEDAERIGLKLREFDIDRASYAKGKFQVSPLEVCELIFKEHGKDCSTYKEAKKYYAEWDKQVSAHSDGIDLGKVCEEKEYAFDQIADEMEAEFLRTILEEYLSILRKEFEYLISSEAIINTIKANEYTFTEDGELEN